MALVDTLFERLAERNFDTLDERLAALEVEALVETHRLKG